MRIGRLVRNRRDGEDNAIPHGIILYQGIFLVIRIKVAILLKIDCIQ